MGEIGRDYVINKMRNILKSIKSQEKKGAEAVSPSTLKDSST